MNRIIILLWICFLQGQAIVAQHTSCNDYTGNWETPASWNPIWTEPQTTISGYSITIDGYITINQPLTFTGLYGNLTVNDTLIVNGDLKFGNSNNLTVNNNGILIVRGNLTIDNHTDVASNGYVIITGDVIKNGSLSHGSFMSNDNPVLLFIGGAVSPTDITNDPDYRVLNCATPVTIPYPNSTCSYGNMTDMLNDPIYSFFQSSCIATPVISASGPLTFCAGDSVTLTSSDGSTYLWSTGATTPSINVTAAGSYTVMVTNILGCQSAASEATVVHVNQLPVVNITSSSSSMCVNELRVLTGNPAGGIFTVIDGPGNISGNELTVSLAGNINLEYSYTGTCTNIATQSIIIYENPVAHAGPDQELKFVFETEMKATLQPSETGEWKLLSGSGNLSDIHSPTTRVTGLSSGDNIFEWKVGNGNCEAVAAVKLTVYELFVPSVITPNNDGKNDFFKITETDIPVELIIFNRWGNEEYTSGNYGNDWDGRNNKGIELSNDTYFYILKFKNGTIKKGTVLIKR